MGLGDRSRVGAESYTPAPGVRTLSLAGHKLLYVESRQQVLELNETADAVWRCLAAGGSIPAAAMRLRALGAPRDQALQLATEAASLWTCAGYLTPRSLQETLASDRPPDRTVVLDELVVDLHVGRLGCEQLDSVFGHLFGIGQGPRRRLTIIEHAGRLLFYLEGDLVLEGAPDGLVAHVKSILTDLYLDAVDDGFLAHGALLEDGERSLMLSGAPGAGKTTLALALAAAGWRYGGDDIVRIGPDGAARGVPFAAAVKRGSLPLLRHAWPRLEDLPEWARGDGQRVRYLLPAHRATLPPRPLSVVVTLARRAGAAARVRPISPVEALSAILGTAYARRWRMTGEAFSALAASLDQAVCVELEFCDLGAAVDAIGEIAGVQAQVA